VARRTGDLLDANLRLQAEVAEQVDAFARAVIEDALRRHGGDIAAADSLNIPKKTLYDKLKRFDISTEQFR
jgi:two-component system C4-dicarboxylate transport response regulator DctD